MENKTGLYIHIPFCVRKCNYCAFLSFEAEGSPGREYADALVNEIALRGNALGHPEIDTVYIGGGTPSVLDISQMSDIMHAVNSSFRIKDGAEITIEANPGTLGSKDEAALAKLQAYRSMGFNRISMGVQSMNNDRLRYLGRIHTAEIVVRDMELIRHKGFENVNLDLIFSIPGSSTQDALDDLERILELKPEHISCYSLQIEEDTPFGRMAEAGELTEVPDEDDRRTYHEICDRLKKAGYEHYEISNFAMMPEGGQGAGFDSSRLVGTVPVSQGEPCLTPSQFRSRHNSLYWDMSDYIGVGLGASGFTGGVRYRNTSDLEKYIRALTSGEEEERTVPLDEEHVNSAFDNISEAVFTGLRRKEGVSYEEAAAEYFRSKDANGSLPQNKDACRDFFWKVFAEAEKEAGEYEDRGLLIIDESGLRLTEQGIDISNSIMSLFV